jgi:hypothetical protein
MSSGLLVFGFIVSLRRVAGGGCGKNGSHHKYTTKWSDLPIALA